ncbi:hypothetical protein P3H15_32635 [Rhodococcus sp. T2V]|uniref:hypothetical protein n=1 Tax=Rhodococcus sp. T2V TaxID=3034164 RepID=UPI0023E0EF00|nr:hypothetical protein [Rhodococcus sp. T2V]MDF3309767.1 hypothetical protein [Rhodococcus sp. T2V]
MKTTRTIFRSSYVTGLVREREEPESKHALCSLAQLRADLLHTHQEAVMARTFPEIRRGTREYREVVRILGPETIFVEDESVRQISRRWLKGTTFVKDENGRHLVVGDELVRKRRRIRIPRDSFLAKGA